MGSMRPRARPVAAVRGPGSQTACGNCAADRGSGRERCRVVRSASPGTAPREGATGQSPLATGRRSAHRCRAREGGQVVAVADERRSAAADRRVTGDSPCSVQLPQAVRLPPLVDAAHGLIVLAAEHSNLIVLDMNQLRERASAARSCTWDTRPARSRRLPWSQAISSCCRSTIRPRKPRSAFSRFPQARKTGRSARCRRSACQVRSPPRRWPWERRRGGHGARQPVRPRSKRGRQEAAFPGCCLEDRRRRRSRPITCFPMAARSGWPTGH